MMPFPEKQTDEFPFLRIPVHAGKSTLMGRLLHDVGAISAKDVHKNQRESAAAGKVTRTSRVDVRCVCVRVTVQTAHQ